MDTHSCSFCQHANPSDAKFCNECGGALQLKPCSFCEAVNDVHAARCHACDASLVEPSGGTPDVDTTADGSPSSSVVRALETIEADLASLALAETRRDDAVPPPVAAHGHHSVTLRGRVLRPFMLATLLLCAIAVVFYGDQRSRPATAVARTQQDATVAPATRGMPVATALRRRSAADRRPRLARPRLPRAAGDATGRAQRAKGPARLRLARRCAGDRRHGRDQP